jgi:hypothetical protein
LQTPEAVVPAFLYLLGSGSRGLRGQRFDLSQPQPPA